MYYYYAKKRIKGFRIENNMGIKKCSTSAINLIAFWFDHSLALCLALSFVSPLLYGNSKCTSNFKFYNNFLNKFMNTSSSLAYTYLYMKKVF